MGITQRLGQIIGTLLLAITAPAAAQDLTGALEQGGIVWGTSKPGSIIRLDDAPVHTDELGRFVLGFGRNHGPTAKLDVDGKVQTLTIAPRQWDVQRINGLPPAKVTPDEAVTARIAQENKAVADVRAQISQRSDVFGTWVKPAQGVTSGIFGSQRILNGEARTPHSGHDIAAATGEPVVAAATGMVSFVHPDMYFTGQTVMIDHGLGVQSVYAHLSQIHVTSGQMVQAGDVIGQVGATGRATGPHLHWGVSWGAVRLDPETVLRVMQSGH